jgi:hypothetical protein
LLHRLADDLRQAGLVNAVGTRKIRDFTIWATSQFKAAAAPAAVLVLSGISCTALATPRRRSSSAKRAEPRLNSSMPTF